MELVLIRHGESLHNVRMSESFDSELTEKGRVQARLTGRELAGEGIEEIWCSPMKRALETASLIAGQLKIPVKVMVELSEFLLTLGEPGYSRSTILEKFPMVELPPEVDEEGWGRHRNSEQLDELRSRMKVVADRIQKLAQTEPEKNWPLLFTAFPERN
jgi:Phosphoglycerate mutase family.